MKVPLLVFTQIYPQRLHDDSIRQTGWAKAESIQPLAPLDTIPCGEDHRGHEAAVEVGCFSLSLIPQTKIKIGFRSNLQRREIVSENS